MLKSDKIDNSHIIKVGTKGGGGNRPYDFITSIKFLKDFTVYNKSKTKKLLTIHKGSFVEFSRTPPFDFRYR